MKTIIRFLFIVTVLSVTLTGCSKENDSSDSLQGGYWSDFWLNYESNIKEEMEWEISKGWTSDPLSMAVGGHLNIFEFVNGNTIKVWNMDCYYLKKPSIGTIIHQEIINNHTVYFTISTFTTYTYAIQNNKIYVTNGNIYTIEGDKLYKDGNSDPFIKKSW